MNVIDSQKSHDILRVCVCVRMRARSPIYVVVLHAIAFQMIEHIRNKHFNFHLFVDFCSLFVNDILPPNLG